MKTYEAMFYMNETHWFVVSAKLSNKFDTHSIADYLVYKARAVAEPFKRTAGPLRCEWVHVHA